MPTVPYRIKETETSPELRKKLIRTIDDIYSKITRSDRVVSVIEERIRPSGGGGGTTPTALPNHDHSGDTGDGGQLNWNDVWNDGVHDHSSNGEGGPLDWDNVWGDAVHNHSSDAEGGTIKLDDWAAPDNNTDLNASVSAHGLCPKLDDDATHFLDGDGAWNDPLARNINAYTQTYSIADRTHENLTSAELTDSTGGSKDNTLDAVTDQSETTDNSVINDNFAELTEEVNALRIDLTDVKQLVNALIDDLQTAGLIS